MSFISKRQKDEKPHFIAMNTYACIFVCVNFESHHFKRIKQFLAEFDIGSFNISRQITWHICVSYNEFDNNRHHFSHTHNIDHLSIPLTLSQIIICQVFVSLESNAFNFISNQFYCSLAVFTPFIFLSYDFQFTTFLSLLIQKLVFFSSFF